jgi:hypothetical protein
MNKERGGINAMRGFSYTEKANKKKEKKKVVLKGWMMKRNSMPLSSPSTLRLNLQILKPLFKTLRPWPIRRLNRGTIILFGSGFSAINHISITPSA